MGEEVKEKKPHPIVQNVKSFGRFLYDSDNGTVMGRGGSSWGKISLFYLIFYSCLAGFFAVCLQVMLMTLDPDTPTVMGRTNKPTVAIYKKDIYKMDFKDTENWEKYKTAVADLKKEYIAAYEKNNNSFNWEDSSLGDCKSDTEFAVNDPTKNTYRGCFFMALNRVVGWQPDGDIYFKCEFVEGKTGKGNTNPPFTLEMMPSVEDQKTELGKSYPWMSTKKSGLQPVVAAKVEFQPDKAGDLTEEDLFTFIECGVYSDGEKLDKSHTANFEIIYEKPGSSSISK